MLGTTKKPTTKPFKLPNPSRVHAEREADTFARQGNRFDTFLRARLGQYLQECPPGYPKPSIDIKDTGSIWIGPVEDPDVHIRKIFEDPTAPQRDDRFHTVARVLAASNQTKAEVALAKLQRESSVVAESESKLAELEEKKTNLEQKKNDLWLAGEITDESTRPKRRMSPSKRSWLSGLVFWGFAVLLVLGESLSVFVPACNFTGIEFSNLPFEWEHNPLGVVSAAVFCLSMTTVFFVLSSHWIKTAFEVGSA